MIPIKDKHCWYRLEYSEESWRPEKTYCYLEISDEPPANVGEKKIANNYYD